MRDEQVTPKEHSVAEETGGLLPPVYIEVGSTGLKRFTGTVDEEFLPNLRGRRAVEVYREMRDNDPVVGALLFGIDMIIRQVSWRVEAGSSSENDQHAAQFVRECMDDMSMTWPDLVSEIMSMLTFGWTWHEVVYKRRVGDVLNPVLRSRHSDGRIGWRKIPIRAQETWSEWEFDKDGGIKGLYQMAPPDYKRRYVPLSKSLLFRTSMHKDNPEGRSVLRNAYRPWYFKKRIEEIEGIGIERDLAGLPVAKIPAEFLRSDAPPEKKAVAEQFRQMVRKVRRDEQEGIILPIAYDPDTRQPLYTLELLNSGGARNFDTDKIITRYEQRIAMTVLADFILLGNDNQGRGSYALSTNKTGMFRTALNSWCKSVAEVFNRYEIPRLFRLNGWECDILPQIVPGQVDPPDLMELGELIAKTSGAGMAWFPDPEVENYIKDAAKLPPREDDQEEPVPPMAPISIPDDVPDLQGWGDSEVPLEDVVSDELSWQTERPGGRQ